ncbi:MFS transporter [Yersinia enterocolitica]
MPLALLILTLSAFSIGTTEFVILGLLPDVARSLTIDIPTAGWLVTGYALGVAIGGPVMALLTAKLQRKKALIILMIVFVLGNVACAVAINYQYLMVARVITALCQAAFFGIGAVVASSLVPEEKKGQAVAMMFAGLTLANVLGVPLGTALGQVTNWRIPFFAIAGLGVIAAAGLWKFLPQNKQEEKVELRDELMALKDLRIWRALLLTVMFDASMFAIFTYVAPILEGVTHISSGSVTLSMLLIGAGLTIGNYIGGKMADWNVRRALILISAALAVVSLVFTFTMHQVIPAEITLFIWAMIAFASVPCLQINVMKFGMAAPNLVATLNIGAFNIGNALGAWVGGIVITSVYGIHYVPVAASAFAFLALTFIALSVMSGKKQVCPAAL